jgi:hypothetical protein
LPTGSWNGLPTAATHSPGRASRKQIQADWSVGVSAHANLRR